jgi:hypothetical protein
MPSGSHEPINTRTHQTGGTMISTYVYSLLLAVLVCQPASADPIYKWVDSKGQVTYSSTPPPGRIKAEKMAVQPPPSEEDIKQARDQVKRAEEQAREMESQRIEQEAREAEEARLRKAQQPQPTVVIEKPVYVPQPIYYPPAIRPKPIRPPHKPEPRPLPNSRMRSPGEPQPDSNIAP